MRVAIRVNGNLKPGERIVPYTYVVSDKDTEVAAKELNLREDKRTYVRGVPLDVQIVHGCWIVCTVEDGVLVYEKSVSGFETPNLR